MVLSKRQMVLVIPENLKDINIIIQGKSSRKDNNKQEKEKLRDCQM